MGRSAKATARAGLALISTLALACGPSAREARRGVWFVGDFESGNLAGWSGDLARPGSAVVVSDPVRGGRHAVRIELAPGDRGANKERAELRIGDKEIERRRGGPGQEIWYGWSLFVPRDFALERESPIVAQWHHRPSGAADRPWKRIHATGVPPLILYLISDREGLALLLVGRTAPQADQRFLGSRPIRRESWIDLVFHIRWSMADDGFVEAWLDGRPFTPGKMRGATLYGDLSNVLRLGLYRPKGSASTINHLYLDEVRLGDSRAAVVP